MKDFNDLFSQAVAIKQSQMQSQRKNFEKLPIFMKTGLYYSQKYASAKNMLFEDRFQLAEQLKTNGNELYKQGKFDEAAHEYEQSLSIFKWIENSNPNWKNEGILDEHLTYHEYSGESPEEETQLKDLKIKLYLNMAACYLKAKKIKESLEACDYALAIEATAKAYFRRAQARLSDINADEQEYEKAIEDLELAQKLDPEDNGLTAELQYRKNQLRQLRRQNRQLYQSMVKKMQNDQNEDLNKKLINKIVEKVDELDGAKTVQDSWVDRWKTKGMILFAVGVLIMVGYLRVFEPDL